MGFISIKQHYRIGHTVHVTKAGICIGSPYIPDLIVIGHDGSIKKSYERGSNEELDRYMQEFRADPEKLKQLAIAKDVFERELPVYTWIGAEIKECHCEEYGWPHTTNEGQLMYENTYFRTREDAVKAAKVDAACGIRWRKEAIEKAERELVELRVDLARLEADSAMLEQHGHQ